MSKRFDPDQAADKGFNTDEADCVIDEWTLDEVDDGADLLSLRSAWTHADDRNE